MRGERRNSPFRIVSDQAFASARVMAKRFKSRAPPPPYARSPVSQCQLTTKPLCPSLRVWDGLQRYQSASQACRMLKKGRLLARADQYQTLRRNSPSRNPQMTVRLCKPQESGPKARLRRWRGASMSWNPKMYIRSYKESGSRNKVGSF